MSIFKKIKEFFKAAPATKSTVDLQVTGVDVVHASTEEAVQVSEVVAPAETKKPATKKKAAPAKKPRATKKKPADK